MSSISMPLLPGAVSDSSTRSQTHEKCCASSCIASEPSLAENASGKPATTSSGSPKAAGSPQNKGRRHSSQENLTLAGSRANTAVTTTTTTTTTECCYNPTGGRELGCETVSVRKGWSAVTLHSAPQTEHKPIVARSCGILPSLYTKYTAEADSAEAIVPLMCDEEETNGEKKTESNPAGERAVEWPEGPAQGPYSRLNESSSLMCRICHGGCEDGELITPCRCAGTVRHAHQSCILNWISKSGHPDCELCKYKFKTTSKKIKSCWKWSFPHISTKGWLHIGLFIAFSTMLLTSITWIVWSRASNAPTALAERTTEEVKFAYMLNGLFIALAIGGLYFDSYKHFKRYSKRWAVMNQHMVVECYYAEEARVSTARATEAANTNGRTDVEQTEPGSWV